MRATHTDGEYIVTTVDGTEVSREINIHPIIQPITQFGTKITQLAFMVRFTSTERKAIKSKATIDADVGDVWDLMQAAAYIELADPKIIGGLTLIASKVPELTSPRSLAVRAVPVVDPLELPGSVRITYGLSEIPT